MNFDLFYCYALLILFLFPETIFFSLTSYQHLQLFYSTNSNHWTASDSIHYLQSFNRPKKFYHEEVLHQVQNLSVFISQSQ